MKSEQWQQIKQIFGAAFDLSLEERPTFLAEACQGDEDLRREVEALLDSFDSEYLEQPAVGEVAEQVIGESQLAVGQAISHYKILQKLGAGGMGEVFLAEDTRLHRQVAIKFLSPLFVSDLQAEKRLMREAQAAAVLDHPNICTIHEVVEADGYLFIVMPYLEGETLAEKLTRGSLPVNRAVGIAIQIADALTEAHAHGIIHRDIKPANVIINQRGQVKVLDFSLAKSVLAEKESESQKDLSQPGQIFGTVAYMSPEQARGLPLDARSDLWSLGVVLHEMLTGKQPFAGETTSDILAAILKTDAAPIRQASREISPKLERISQKLLCKNRAERYQTARELLFDLKNLRSDRAEDVKSDTFDAAVKTDLITTQKQKFSTDEQTAIAVTEEKKAGQTQSSAFSFRWLWPLATIAFLLLGFAAFAWWQKAGQIGTDLSSMRPKTLVSWNTEAGEGERSARFSPSGMMIAYSLMKNGQRNIWTKQVPDGKPNQITDGKWSYRSPIWSPDGERIACLSERDGQAAIWALPFSGGELKLIKDLGGEYISLKQWSKDGATLYYQASQNLFALEIASGKIRQLTNFDLDNPAQFISVSPAADRIVYSSETDERLHLFVMPIGGGQPVQLTADETDDEHPVWLPDGQRIIYNCKRDGILQTCLAYLNARRTEQININISDTLISDVSADGDKILFFHSREECDLWRANLVEKKEAQLTSDYGIEIWSDAAPDGKNVVFQAATEAKHLHEAAIVIRSTEDDRQIKIASGGFVPTFSPDGGRVAFLRFAGDQINLWTVSAIGADEKRLTTDDIWFDGFNLAPYNLTQIADYSWSPDGQALIYSAKKSGSSNIWKTAADGSGVSQQISRNADPNLRLISPLFSPDGRRVAFVSNYIKTLPDQKNVWKIQMTGEKTEVIFSSESLLKLIGWAQTGGDLIVAMREGGGNQTKPVRVRLLQISVDGVRQSEIATIESAYFNNLRLSPDKQKIAVATRQNGKDSLRVVSRANGQISQITENADPNVYLSEIVWSPDSKTIFYSKQSEVGLLSMIENFK